MVSFLGLSLGLVSRAITNGTRNALKVDIPVGGKARLQHPVTTSGEFFYSQFTENCPYCTVWETI